jgi:hypothetical protein
MTSVVPSPEVLLQRTTNLSVDMILKNELTEVHSQVQEIIIRLNGVSEDRAGIEILHFFVQDLLGRDTTAAKIFRAKTSEDFTEMPFVTTKTKITIRAILVVLNLFFIYFSILRGHQKGVEWQWYFVGSCLVQAAVEIVFNQTFECLYIHYFLPRMVPSKDLNKVREVLHSCIDKLCSGDGQSAWHKNPNIVDAPQYLFVSTNVAKAYPMLMESMMVLSYHTHLPGEFEAKWKAVLHHPTNVIIHRDSDTSIGSFYTFMSSVKILFKSVSMVIVLVAMQFMAFVPLPIQKFVIRFVEPLLIAMVAFSWLFIRQNTIAVICVAVCMTGSMIYAIYSYKKAINKEQQLHNLPSQQSGGDIVDLEIEDVDCNSQIDSADRHHHGLVTENEDREGVQRYKINCAKHGTSEESKDGIDDLSINSSQYSLSKDSVGPEAANTMPIMTIELHQLRNCSNENLICSQFELSSESLSCRSQFDDEKSCDSLFSFNEISSNSSLIEETCFENR